MKRGHFWNSVGLMEIIRYYDDTHRRSPCDIPASFRWAKKTLPISRSMPSILLRTSPRLPAVRCHDVSVSQCGQRWRWRIHLTDEVGMRATTAAHDVVDIRSTTLRRFTWKKCKSLLKLLHIAFQSSRTLTKLFSLVTLTRSTCCVYAFFPRRRYAINPMAMPDIE